MPLGGKWKNTVLKRKIKNLLMADWILNIHDQYLEFLILWELFITFPQDFHENCAQKRNHQIKTTFKVKFLLFYRSCLPFKSKKFKT